MLNYWYGFQIYSIIHLCTSCSLPVEKTSLTDPGQVSCLFNHVAYWSFTTVTQFWDCSGLIIIIIINNFKNKFCVLHVFHAFIRGLIVVASVLLLIKAMLSNNISATRIKIIN